MPKVSDADANTVFIRDKDLTRALAEALQTEHEGAVLIGGKHRWGSPEPCNVCKLLDIYDQIKEDV